MLGTVERERAYSTVHEGAIYLHLGQQYVVRALDTVSYVALVVPFDGDYYTQTRRLSATSIEDFRTAVLKAKQSTRTTVIHVETDPLVPAPDSPAWWDVPVAEVSALDSTQQARTTYEEHKTHQRSHLAPPDNDKDHA